MTYRTTPYIVGDTATWAQIMRQASAKNTRIAVFGDSQESATGTGKYRIGHLNGNCWRQIGKCSETPVIPPTQDLVDQGLWCSHSRNYLVNTKLTPNSFVLPGKSVVTTTATGTSGGRVLVVPKADYSYWQPRGLYDVFNVTSGTNVELFAYTHTDGGPELFFRSIPSADIPGGSFFGTPDVSASSSGLQLDQTDNLPVKWSVPNTIPYDATKPVANVVYRGDNGSGGGVAGNQLAGARFISRATTGGIVWDSFGVGGFVTGDLADDHANAGAMMRTMGPWHGVYVGIGTNNSAVIFQTAVQFKAAMLELIAYLRGANWFGHDIPILLTSDTARNDLSAGQETQDQLYADVLADIADEEDSVLFINLRRIMEDNGYDPDDIDYSSDGIHATELGQRLEAEAITHALFGLTADSNLADGVTAESVASAVLVAMGNDPPDVNVVEVNGTATSLLAEPVDANVTQVNGSSPTLLSDPLEVDLTANAISGVVNGVKADPPTVNLTEDTINSISGNISTKVSLAIGTTNSNEVLSTSLEVFQGEKIQQTIVALLSDLTTPIDLSGLTLELIFETTSRALLSVIPSANIAISGDNNNLVTFTYPDIVTSTIGTKIWTLRDTNDASKVRLNGTIKVVRAAINTSS